ncbi:hypothetical protein Hs30E_09380 [Lactococcus hodotermopsidis]|uniref:General stress protein n=1 Tax=Pseudolactococcus hodotermopsidis TaxID=2709157 RepID=A0A6A0BEX2_9LACT|nr:YtxH domain-containing protein [Lactococcus hodotermopsidis]GFH42387.1 hypothetical protein Hs30E_09380 [Lactococcus hodotermopsidis]
MAKKSGFLVGIALGTVVGAVAALAAAPKEGKKLRQDVKDFYTDYKEDPKAKFVEVKESAVNFAGEKSSQVVEFSTEKFNDIKEKFDNGDISAEKAKAYLTSKKDDIKAKVDSGELSKDKVLEFLNATKDKIAGKVNELKEAKVEDFDDEAFDGDFDDDIDDDEMGAGNDFTLEIEQEALVNNSDVEEDESASSDKSYY